MKSRESIFFWASFTDLMTSLFFIMLVLYVLTYVKMSVQQQATAKQLSKIKEINAAVKALPTDYFAYDSVYKRFYLKKNIEFEPEKWYIKEKDIDYLAKVGNSIKVLIEDLHKKYAKQDIKYVVIIEGMASKDNYEENYPLSYKRALAVQKLWENKNIVLDPSVCEVQIAGSGIGGVGRYPPDEEYRNQRILIQIVPKIGEIKAE